MVHPGPEDVRCMHVQSEFGYWRKIYALMIMILVLEIIKKIQAVSQVLFLTYHEQLEFCNCTLTDVWTRSCATGHLNWQ